MDYMNRLVQYTLDINNLFIFTGIVFLDLGNSWSRNDEMIFQDKVTDWTEERVWYGRSRNYELISLYLLTCNFGKKVTTSFRILIERYRDENRLQKCYVVKEKVLIYIFQASKRQDSKNCMTTCIGATDAIL